MDRKTPAVPVPTPNAKKKSGGGSHSANSKVSSRRPRGMRQPFEQLHVQLQLCFPLLCKPPYDVTALHIYVLSHGDLGLESSKAKHGWLPQGLLKDQLELVKVQVDGRTRYSIKPIEEQLSFDKVIIGPSFDAIIGNICVWHTHFCCDPIGSCFGLAAIYGIMFVAYIATNVQDGILRAIFLLPPTVPTKTPLKDFLLQGFYVFIRAIQALTNHNQGVVVVRPDFQMHGNPARSCCLFLMGSQQDNGVGNAGRLGRTLWFWEDCLLRKGAGLYARYAAAD